MMKQQYLKKYSPVLYVREMFKAQNIGNRTVGWFAGARIIRRVADGNTRRFLQIMHALTQAAFVSHLIPKSQHRVLVDFCRNAKKSIPGLPRYGLLTDEVIETVGGMLHRRTHDGPLLEAGCDFLIDENVLRGELFQNAIRTGVAYSHFVLPDPTVDRIVGETRLRLSFLHAVCFWLPMRKGDPPPRITGNLLAGGVIEGRGKAVEAVEDEEVKAIKEMQLTLELPNDREDEDED